MAGDHRSRDVRQAFESGIDAALARGDCVTDLLVAGFRAVFELLSDAEGRVRREDLDELPLWDIWPEEPVTWDDAEGLLSDATSGRWTDDLANVVGEVFDTVETIVTVSEENAWVDYCIGVDLAARGDDVYCYTWERGCDFEPTYEVRWSHRRADPAGRRAAFERAIVDQSLTEAYGRVDIGLAPDFPPDLRAALRASSSCPPWDEDAWRCCREDLDSTDLAAGAQSVAVAHDIDPADAQRALERFREDAGASPVPEVERTVAWWLYERLYVSSAR
jgi:hypothetical protein